MIPMRNHFSLVIIRSCLRVVAAAGVSISLVWTATMGGGVAMASQGVCRSDPIVVLSSLKVLDLSATINDSNADLNSVTYTMDLPAGVRPLLVVPTDGLVGQVEHFVWHADKPAGQYSVSTYVSTGYEVPVTAVGLSVLAKSYVVNGMSNETITVSV